MSQRVSFFNLSVNKLLSKQQSIIDQVRIRLLYYTLCLGFVSLVFLWFNVYLQHEPMFTLVAGVCTAIIPVLFKYYTWKGDWRTTSHVLLGFSTIVNLLNIFVIMQSVNIITVLLIILIILYSYYMLGSKWGLWYSLANIIPAMIFMIIEYDNSYFINLKPEKVDGSTLIIAALTLFVMVIFIHSQFYLAFVRSIQQLKKTTDEQGRLNLKLETAIEKAEKSSQAKSEFLSTMSHEIRTPLNAVIGMSNLLLMGNPRPDQKENLDILKFSGSNLLAIVNDVLDFNKIESGKLVFENIKFNLPELMSNICGGQIIKAQEKGLKFQLSVDESLRRKLVFGDPTRLTQVTFNLISNAIKFTKQGSVHVRVATIEDRHNTITVNFTIQDTGIGIEKDNLNAIFEPFTQESITTTRQYGGTGLGLAIVKRLLELQNVQMQVKSKPGEGSEFSFNMEFTVSTEKYVEPAAQVQQLSSTADLDVLKSLKVLIAEDNPVNVMLMKKLFSKWSLLPVFADNGERAIEKVQYGNFDIILMDLQMPVMNGFDAATEIRKLPDTQKSGIPIIALTASALTDIRERVFASGMNDYVSKPFKPEELKEKILQLTAPHLNEVK
jgi:signal transduction histidine kinase/CheY-like chemotaxis protein